MVGTVGGDGGESVGSVGDPSRHRPAPRNGRAVGASPSPPCAGIPCAAHLARHASCGRNDGVDDGGGVKSDDGVVMTVAMKLRDEGEDGGQLC